MGKLALWGGIGGAGKALVQSAENEIAAKFAAEEEQRQIRLANLRQKHAIELEKERQKGDESLRSGDREHAKDMQGSAQEFTRERDQMEREFKSGERRADRSHDRYMQEDSQEFTHSRDEAARAFKSTENIADREHDVRIQTLRNKGQLDAVSARTTSAKKDTRWITNKVKRSELVGETLTEVEVTVVTDKQTGMTFEQEGNKFVPQGSTVRLPLKRAEAEKDLMEEKIGADLFIEAFGYLPAKYIKKYGGQ